MIRMLIPLVIIFLAYTLAKTFMDGRAEQPIDVDPVEASRGSGTSRPSDDDIIDVEPM